MDAVPPPLPAPALAALPGDLTASVAVTVEPALSLVTYTLAGFLNADSVRRVGEEQGAAMAKLRCPPNQHLTVIDVAGCKIQSQDVIEGFRSILDDPRFQARKLAVVVGMSLARMQLRRVLHRDNVRYVETCAEARAWLTEAD